MSAPTLERSLATLDPTMTARHLRINQLGVNRMPGCAVILRGEMDERGLPIPETVQPFLVDADNELHPTEFVSKTPAELAIGHYQALTN